MVNRTINVELVKRFGDKPVVGVEIGVRSGVNARELCRILNIKKLYLIDPYLPYKELSGSVWSEEKQKIHKESAKNYLSKFNVVFIYEKSDDAFKLINEKLDFVYIDGNHTYEQVTNDIKYYYPLIKKGGVISGHDFTPKWSGLQKAVLEFKKDVIIRGNNWWFIKDE